MKAMLISVLGLLFGMSALAGTGDTGSTNLSQITCSGLLKNTSQGQKDQIAMGSIKIERAGQASGDQRLVKINVGDFEVVSLVDDSNNLNSSSVFFKKKTDAFKADITLTDIAAAGKAEVAGLDRVFELKIFVNESAIQRTSTISGLLSCKEN